MKHMTSQVFSKTVTISARPDAVWHALTNEADMKLWLGEPEMDVDVDTTWEVGTPICITGTHHERFAATGTVLAFERGRLLRYSQLSSLSRLDDTPENHSILEFRLDGSDSLAATVLTIAVSGCPNDVIAKHLALYWGGTADIIRKHVEALSSGGADAGDDPPA